MNEDEWAEEVARKHLSRSGIRRLYCYKDTRGPGRLQLEVVLRGKVFFHIPLWKIKPMFEDD